MRRETITYRYGGNVAWGDYLLENSFNKLAKKVDKQTTALFDIGDQQASTIIGSQQIMSDTINTGLDQLRGDLGAINNSIIDMHSDFNYYMALTVGALESLDESFKEMIRQLDAIYDTLNHPLRTKFIERREMGYDRLRKKLWDKALESFLEANELFDTDFIVNLELGKLYLYGKDELVDLLNYDEAKKYFLNAARYAKSESSDIPNVLEIASEAFFHCSVACYVISNSYTTKDSKFSVTLLEEALNYVNKAIELNSGFAEAHYHKAKYAALLKDKVQFKVGVENALLLDRKYIFKIYTDEDILSFKNELDKIVLNLINNYKTECSEKIRKINTINKSYFDWNKGRHILLEIKDKIKNIEILLNSEKYLDVRKANEEINVEWIQYIDDELPKVKKELFKGENDLRKESLQLLTSLQEKRLERYIDAEELSVHQKKVLDHKSQNANREELMNSKAFLESEKEWLEETLNAAEAKLSRKNEIKYNLFDALENSGKAFLFILGIVAMVFPIIAGYIFFDNIIYVEENFNFFLIVYIPSIIILVSSLVLATCFVMWREDIFENILFVLGICAIGPIIYLLGVVVLTIVLAIPFMFMALIGADELIDAIWKDGIIYGGFILMSIVQWIYCMVLIFRTDN